MRSIFPPIKSKPLFDLDFSLAYVGIVLLGFSIAGTELTKIYPENKSEIIQIRLLHTAYLVLIVYLTQLVLKKLKTSKTGYLGLCLIGLWLSIPSLIVRIFLMRSYELISSNQISVYFLEQFIIILVQALFWVPVVIILGGQRSKILGAFKNYETHLLISARKSIRTSTEFTKLNTELSQNFKKELNLHSSKLLNLIKIDNEKLTLTKRNSLLQPYLKANSLRELSQILTHKSETIKNNSKFLQDLHSINLISKQFNILYNYVARNAPMPAFVYTLASFVLILPNYINFFTAKEILLTAPPLFLSIHFVAIWINKILKIGGKYAILQTNLLILLIGFLPFLELQIGKLYVDDASTQFPTVIIGLFYPIGFFVYMRFCQIIQPESISAISRNEIYASPALNNSIMRILQDEFKYSMSHQWATYIHGKILTRIAATSLKLEQSVDNNDPESFKNGLNNLKMILENPTKDFEQNQLNLRLEVASRLDPWEGLIKINLSIDQSLENVSNSRVKDVGEAIEEIISNSVRHGGSQNIWINITLLDHPDIQLLIDDDAVNPIPLVLPRIGLGTKILNLVSDGRWSITHRDGKTTVKLVMALL